MIVVSRIVAALLLGLLGFQIGRNGSVGHALRGWVDELVLTGILTLAGALFGLLVGGVVGRLLQRALRALAERLLSRSAAELVTGALGLVIGLGVALLFNIALGSLPFVDTYLILPITLIVAYVFAHMATEKHEEILRLVGIKVDREPPVPGKLLDTSVLIDGRVPDIIRAGFLEGELVVPVFVLEELQRIADSTDPARRARGRRGLDVVKELRKKRLLSTPQEDYDDIAAVDSKLVRLATEHGYVIVTTDFNLNTVAQIQQVKVLNIHELANALKPEFVPGDTFEVKLLKQGKEPGQGVGYLDDGTMVIVEQGAEHLGSTQYVTVTSVLQSPTGKLVFARLESAASAASGQT